MALVNRGEGGELGEVKQDDFMFALCLLVFTLSFPRDTSPPSLLLIPLLLLFFLLSPVVPKGLVFFLTVPFHSELYLFSGPKLASKGSPCSDDLGRPSCQ